MVTGIMATENMATGIMATGMNDRTLEKGAINDKARHIPSKTIYFVFQVCPMENDSRGLLDIRSSHVYRTLSKLIDRTPRG